MKALGPYILSEEDTRAKVHASINKHRQLVFDAIHKLLLDGLSALDRSDLRGDPNERPARPDKIAEFFDRVLKSTDAIRHLDRLQKRTKRAYTVIIGTIIVAGIGTIVGFLSSSSEYMKIAIAALSILLLGVQAAVVVVLRFCKGKVENYE